VLQDLPFKKGEALTVINSSEDPNWWLAKNKGGKVACVLRFFFVAHIRGGIPRCGPLATLLTHHPPNLPRAAKVGMIPANYVEATSEKGGAVLPRDSKGNLEPMPWFHGKISRELAEELLTPRKDGQYLIRESTNYPGDYTLCVRCEASTLRPFRSPVRPPILPSDRAFIADVSPTAHEPHHRPLFPPLTKALKTRWTTIESTA
jgi:c-src tyrosine kinase